MNYKPILIVAGEPNSIFLELFFKIKNKKRFKSPLILIASKNVLKLQMKKLKYKEKIRILDYKKIDSYLLDNKLINLINVNYKTKKSFEKITVKSNNYINKCFNIAFQIIKSGKTNKFINGPIVKKTFLKKKFLGMTEFISDKFQVKKKAMLIYNKQLSVSPITTHLPLKYVSKKINKKLIFETIYLIHEFYKKNLGISPKIGITGINPHCETTDKENEDEKVIKPAIKYLINLGYNISGPYPADTIFLKKNRNNFDVIVGMYHDQVLTPLKTLYEYDAINITLGLPFIRISPDHGPNEKMMGKNLSNPLSLIKAITFLDKN